MWDEGDWDQPVAQAPLALEDTEEQAQDKFKVEMQRLHMSEENQELIKAMLMEVRGGELRLRKEKSYRDQGRRLDHGYWLKDNQLLVRGVQDFSEERTIHPSGLAEEDSLQESGWAHARLASVGFHKSRCSNALERTQGDCGAAMELLMVEGFGLKLPGRPGVGGSSSDPEDCSPGEIVPTSWREHVEEDDDDGLEDMEQREEEKMALESIYESSFQEKIAGRVWELNLPLEHLWRYLPGGSKDPKRAPPKPKDPNEKKVCKFFSAGHCKFGKRCREKHVQPDNTKPTDDRHLRGEDEQKGFTLEVRFPEGSKYPMDPCLAVFSSLHSHFPRAASIKITAKLMRTAAAMAREGSPAVFQLVELLQDARELDRVVAGPEHKLSLPAVLGVESLKEPEEQEEEERRDLLKVLAKPARDEERRRVDERKAREVDRRLRIRFKEMKARGDDDRMMKVRRGLPAWEERGRVVQLLRKSQVIRLLDILHLCFRLWSSRG